MIKSILSLIFFFCFSKNIFAQNTFRVIVKDEKENKLLSGVSVVFKKLSKGSVSDENGFAAVAGIPDGEHLIAFNAVGYDEIEQLISFPQKDTLVILMESQSEELEDVQIVTTTRSNRNIKDIPTRIETIALADLEEKSVMQPGNIKVLASEIAGVQSQQLSQVSGNTSLRIQGLDGKYTQLLQDGFPLYSGLSAGLSVMQIPPLNLQRVEVIKGSSSTLYGGGAIAGLINLITKEPGEKRELSFLANVNQTNALDLSSYYAKRFKKTGMTCFVSGNFQKAYDANNDGFSDIPKYNRYTFCPKFFYYPNNKTTLSLGINTGFENRTGGDMLVIDNKSSSTRTFFETNQTNRYSTQAKFEKIFANKNILTIKNSVGYFKRAIKGSNYNFTGQQIASFSEINYLIPKDKSEWNIGANLISDDFKQLNNTAGKLNYFNAALGVFAQSNLNLSKKIILESGLRFDVTNRNQYFLLPRVSMLYKINNNLTSRIGGGLGYKTPTIFTEEAEARAFQNIAPLDFSKINPDRSYGINADLNYKTIVFKRVYLSVNQLFFYTKINDPFQLNQVVGTNQFYFGNAIGNIDAKGFETILKFRIKRFSGFLGYTYTDVNRNLNTVSGKNPLTAKHHINFDVIYEIHEKLRIGYELFYTGKQFLTSGEKVRDYWVTGLAGQYYFKHFSLFLNVENFLDVRQSKWESLYAGSIQSPQFREVYTPTDGIIINGGIKISL